MPLVFFLSHEVKTMMMTFHAGKLWLTLSNLAAARISYHRGKDHAGEGKVGDLTTDVGTLDRQRAGLDCSGYIQYVVYQGSSHNSRIPQGTVKQQEWLDEKKYRKVSGNQFVSQEDVYNYEASKKDDMVRIAFRATDSALKNDSSSSESAGVGHVWLVINGKTYECTTKGRGSGPRSFNFDERSDDADALYVLGSAHGFAAHGPLLTAAT